MYFRSLSELTSFIVGVFDSFYLKLVQLNGNSRRIVSFTSAILDMDNSSFSRIAIAYLVRFRKH